MTIDALVRCLRRRWVLVAISLLACLGASLLLARQVDAVYEARSTVLVRSTAEPHGVASYDGARYAARQAGVYQTFVQQRVVLTEVMGRLGLETTVGQLRRRVGAGVPQGSPLIVVVARGGAPEEAARLSSAVADSLVAAIARAEAAGAPDAEGQVDGRLIATESPPQPTQPRVALYLAAGLLAGAALGIGLAVAAGAPRARSPETPGLDDGVRRGLFPAHGVWLLLLAATVPWRRDVYFEGGVDAVVLLKAVLSVAALAVAWWLVAHRDHGFDVPAWPVVVVLGYLSVTVVGGLANRTLPAALVVAARVAILVVAVCLLVRRYGASRAAVSLLHVLAALVTLAALTGLPGMADRLHGGVPPLHPNGLASMTGMVCVWLVSRLLAGTDRWWHLVGVVACLGVILLTGSRTTLGVLVLACLVMLPRAAGVRRSTFLWVVLALPLLAWVLLGTDLVTAVAFRGGEEQVLSLSNRLIAWQAALGLSRDGWEAWFGQGLAQKHIEVTGTWWDSQLLDSSWVSAWVQGGGLGLGLAALLAASALVGAAVRPSREGSLWLGLSVFPLALGVMESGLFDASVAFLVLLTSALAVATREGRP